MTRTLSVDSLIGRLPLPLRLGAAILALCGLILAMVADRASILRSGATVRLSTEPIDPRDLFRGDYVVLRYRISAINLTRLGVVGQVRNGDRVFVGLRAGADGLAEVAALARAGESRRADLIWAAGKAGQETRCFTRRAAPGDCAEGDRVLRVTYGIESYFVPQGEGLAIERTNAARVQVQAAVAADGRMAIKALLIDGKPVYEEPPF